MGATTTQLVVTGVVAAAIACAAPCGASEAGSFTLNAVTLAAAPQMDGTIGETWTHAAHATLDWEFNIGKPAHEPTDVYLGVDAHYLYVAFDARQAEPVTATQATNNVGDGSDDEVQVYVWPGGPNGFAYTFAATPNGTRYQYSTENNNYAPTWTAAGTTRQSGYAVTMRIPLDAMRGGARSEWRIQFARQVHATHEVFEWAHAPGQQAPGQTVYAGHLAGVATVASAARTKPRAGIYALASAASQMPGIDVAHRRRHRRPDYRHLVARGDDPSRLLERRGGSAEYRPQRVPALLQRDAPLLLARDQRVRQQLLRLPRHHRTLHALHPDAQPRLRARGNARAGDVDAYSSMATAASTPVKRWSTRRRTATGSSRTTASRRTSPTRCTTSRK